MKVTKMSLFQIIVLALFLSIACGGVNAESTADKKAVTVNVDNFVRAETAAQFDRMLEMTGGVNRWLHLQQPTPLDKQTVIRMNRDTLYSAAIVDISEGATLTIPDSGERYMSVMVVNEDHYINKVFHEAGKHVLNMSEFDTPYVSLSVRTLVDASDPEDVKRANALQSQLKVEANSSKPYTHPDYDKQSYQATIEAVLALGRGVPDARRSFGKKEDVDAVRHFLATGWGWGGLPEEEAMYLNVEPNLPVGMYKIDVKDVPVDAFWSISVYNKDGFFEENKLNAYNVNNITGTANEDGSFTVHFGGCEEKHVNCLPITEGWNYTVRMYQPRQEVIDGSWVFPAVRPVND